MHKNWRRLLTLLLALVTVLSLLPVTAAQAAAMKQGSKGTEVKRLQQNLIGLGFLEGTADGSFGSKTKKAVQEFQAGLSMQGTGNRLLIGVHRLRHAGIRGFQDGIAVIIQLIDHDTVRQALVYRNCAGGMRCHRRNAEITVKGKALVGLGVRIAEDQGHKHTAYQAAVTVPSSAVTMLSLPPS